MQHNFKIGEREFIAVGVPADYYNEVIANGMLIWAHSLNSETDIGVLNSIDLKGDFKILFSYPCTEEEAASLVQFNQYGHNGWKDYRKKSDLMYWCKNAVESLASKLEAEGIYTVNPFGKYSQKELIQYWPSKCTKCNWRGLSRDCAGGEAIADTGDYDDAICPKCYAPEEDDFEWQQAQERTSEKWLLIEIKK